MDSLTFLLDSLAIVILVVWGLKDDRRASSQEMTSIFRFREDVAPARRRGTLGRRSLPPGRLEEP